MTLLAPAFLAGLLAIGVPLWLHRLSANNPHRRRFSSLMFLEAGEPRRVLAKKLQYLMLLALRIGVLALLALAFAQPAVFLAAGRAAGNGSRLQLLVVDTSASMAYQGRWSRARKAALDLIDSLPPGDRIRLIAADRSVKLLSGASASRAELRRDVNSLMPTDFHLDYGRMMRSVDDVVRGAKLPVVVHIVTDAQRSALPDRFAELAPREPAALDIRNVASGSKDNWLIAQAAGSGTSGVVTATVRSYAQSPAKKTVALSLNGRQVQKRQVTIAAGGTAEVGFAPLELKSGANRVALSLEPGDGLSADDRRYLALKRVAPRPVLLVSGDARDNDTLYVASALQTLTDLALDVERTGTAKLSDEKSLGKYAFIVVADAGALDAADTSKLSAYVNGGGALLMAFGPRSNSLTTVPLTGQAFRPVAQAGTGQQDYAAVGAMDASHPALRGVDGLRAARFFHYADIQPGRKDAVLMRLDDGTPLLLERRVGDGRVLLFTSTLDREWNDLPVHSAYVPLIAGLAKHMLGGEGFRSAGRLGSVLSLQAAGMSGGQIFNPEGKPALGLGGSKGSVLLDQTGFYELVGGGSRALVAVNFDPKESNLATMTPDELSRWKGLGRPAAQTAAGGAPQRTSPRPTPLADWLLWLLLAVIVVESWVGNWHLRVRRGVPT